MKLSLVIPAYNESSIIEATLRTVTARLAEMDPDYELLIVDDGSTDNMADLVRPFEDGHVRLTGYHPNGAVGCPGQHQLMAGKEGRRARRRAGDGDVIVVHRPPEQTVPDTAAHQPALLAGLLQPGKHRQHLRRQPVSGHRLTPPGGRGRPGPPCRSAPPPRTSAAPRGRRSPPGG